MGGGVSGARRTQGTPSAAARGTRPVSVNGTTQWATPMILGCAEMMKPGVDGSLHAQFTTTTAFWAASSFCRQQLGSVFAGARGTGACWATAGPLLQPQFFAPGLSPQQQVAKPETLQHEPPATEPVATGQPMLPAMNANRVNSAIKRPRPVSDRLALRCMGIMVRGTPARMQAFGASRGRQNMPSSQSQICRICCVHRKIMHVVGTAHPKAISPVIVQAPIP